MVITDVRSLIRALSQGSRLVQRYEPPFPSASCRELYHLEGPSAPPVSVSTRIAITAIRSHRLTADPTLDENGRQIWRSRQKRELRGIGNERTEAHE
jgi:hypothetical protein